MKAEQYLEEILRIYNVKDRIEHHQEFLKKSEVEMREDLKKNFPEIDEPAWSQGLGQSDWANTRFNTLKSGLDGEYSKTLDKINSMDIAVGTLMNEQVEASVFPFPNNSYVIGLSNPLKTVSYEVCRVIAAFIGGSNDETGEPFFGTINEKEVVRLLKSILHSFIILGIPFRMDYNTSKIDYKITTNHARRSTGFSMGFQYFTLCHELMHILLQHKFPKQLRDGKSDAELHLEQRIHKLNPILNQESVELFANIQLNFLQRMGEYEPRSVKQELEADRTAIEMLFHSILNIYGFRGLQNVYIGILTYFEFQKIIALVDETLFDNIVFSHPKIKKRLSVIEASAQEACLRYGINYKELTSEFKKVEKIFDKLLKEIDTKNFLNFTFYMRLMDLTLDYYQLKEHGKFTPDIQTRQKNFVFNEEGLKKYFIIGIPERILECLGILWVKLENTLKSLGFPYEHLDESWDNERMNSSLINLDPKSKFWSYFYVYDILLLDSIKYLDDERSTYANYLVSCYKKQKRLNLYHSKGYDISKKV